MNHLNIILGNKAFFNRTVFQACACETSNYREARSATQQMKLKFKNCTWAGIVYKIPTGEDCYEEIPTIGKKMLLLMNRMNSMNLTIGVGIWYSGNITTHDCNRMVLDRVMDIIYYLSSLNPIETVQIEEKSETEMTECDPIDSHKHLNFPSRPEPSYSFPQDTRVDLLRSKMSSILDSIDGIEANSIHELTYHSLVGKVLKVLFCLLNKVPYTVKRAKQYFLTENFAELLKDFEPNNMRKRQIKALKKMLKDCEKIDLKRVEKISHTAVLVLEYCGLILDLITDVEMPQAVVKPEEPPIVEVEEPKRIIYHSLPRKRAKEGVFMQVKEMVRDEKDRISPMKIAINVRDASNVNLDFGHLPMKEKKLRHASVDRDFSSFHKFFINKSQDLTPVPSWKTKNKGSVPSLKSKTRLNNYSVRTIDLNNKKSQVFSKISLNASKKSIGPEPKSLGDNDDDELIDRVLNLNISKPNVGIDRNESEEGLVKGINNNEIDKQPMSVLVKFAEILRQRRETHTLL